jgi:hypothetical protein
MGGRAKPGHDTSLGRPAGQYPDMTHIWTADRSIPGHDTHLGRRPADIWGRWYKTIASAANDCEPAGEGMPSPKFVDDRPIGAAGALAPSMVSARQTAGGAIIWL